MRMIIDVRMPHREPKNVAQKEYVAKTQPAILCRGQKLFFQERLLPFPFVAAVTDSDVKGRSARQHDDRVSCRSRLRTSCGQIDGARDFVCREPGVPWILIVVGVYRLVDRNFRLASRA